MFCPNCGKPNQDGFKFCYSCGTPLPQVTAAEPQPQYIPPQPQYTPPQYTPPQPQYAPPAKAAEPVRYTKEVFRGQFRGSWRDFVASPLMLIAVLCFTIMVLLNVSQTTDLMSDLFAIDELQEVLTEDDSLDSFMDIMSVVIPAAMIPSILIIVGLWMIFVEGCRKDAEKINTSGLSMIQYALVANMVILGICLALVLFSSCSVMSQIAEAERNLREYGMEADFSEAESIMTGVIIGTLIGGGLMMAYYRLLMLAVQGSKDAIEAYWPDHGYLAAAAVCKFIFAGLSFISNSSIGITAVTILSIAAQVLFGILLLMYKAKMETLSDAYNRIEFKKTTRTKVSD